jgi:hypothetical protein
MKLLRNLSLAFLMLTAALLPALGGTVISNPSNGEQVSSPFNLTMSADTCSSRPVVVVGYSLDNSPSTSAWPDHQINGPVGAPDGWHTLHVKVWNDYGAVCVTDVSVNVGGGAVASAIPGNASRVSSIQTLGNWREVHDGGTPGWSSGWTGVQSSPSMSGAAREFATTFNHYGGHRYSVQFDDDQWSNNFFLDTWVYIADSADGFSNLEFDLNQTMSNGETVIMGFQCDSWVQRWDYSVNGGSPTAPNDTWLHSYAPCNVHSWAVNKWHHVQIYFSRNSSGWVTYHSVWLDGAQQNLNFTVFSGYDLGWGPSLVTNFQIDGSSSGTTWGNVYMDEISVFRW